MEHESDYTKALKENIRLKEAIEAKRLQKENEQLRVKIGDEVNGDEFLSRGFEDALRSAGVSVKDIAKGERL